MADEQSNSKHNGSRSEPADADSKLRLDEWSMLLEEHAAVWGQDGAKPPKTRGAYAQEARAANLAALCLSGGGIRSAAFSLGAIQALAQGGLLNRFEYLSTVSGGGYIGGWLSRWIHASDNDVDLVQRKLASSAPDDNGADEAAEIKRLRARSNFLTPRVGLASADTWTAAVIVIRNLVLNWMIFVPALLLVGTAFLLWQSALILLSDILPPLGIGMAALPLVCLGLLLIWTTWRATMLLPSYAGSGEMQRVAYASPASIRHGIVMPSLAWSVLLLPASLPVLQLNSWAALAIGPAVAFVAPLIGYFGAMASRTKEKAHRKQFARNISEWVFACACSAAVLFLGYCLAAQVLPKNMQMLAADRRWLVVLIVLTPLWATICHLVLSLVYAGVRRGPKRAEHALRLDLDREWLARLSAMKLKWPLILAGGGLACLLLPILVFECGSETLALTSSGLTAILAAIGGKSALSNIVPGKEKWWRPVLRGGITLLTFLAMLALLMCAAWLASRAVVAAFKPSVELVRLPASCIRSYSSTDHRTFAIAYLVILAVGIFLLLFLQRWLDINRFSLHALYRNRVVRAFLGSARRWRDPDPFTDFDGADNIRMAALWAPRKTGPVRRPLFPVVNLAMNVSGADQLAWQERKALSFSVTPLRSGWQDPLRRAVSRPDIANPDLDPCRKGAPETYVKTAMFGGREADLGMAPTNVENPLLGISLGTAMTISGAAVSPNMGYHSSPVTSFLMTLFNVRLGSWLPNPKTATEEILRLSGPKSALKPLLDELMGEASSEAPYVYLSDGGHFDNLGIYEMVRRRCRYIVVVDAGADIDCKFEDLGMAVRKIFIDMHVQIDLDEIKIRSRRQSESVEGDMVFCALGRITYPDLPPDEARSDRPASPGGSAASANASDDVSDTVPNLAAEPPYSDPVLVADPSDPDPVHGYLLYLKPSFKGDVVPIDVRSYAATHEDFPHESTADQWFAESQFESYRRLGEYLMDKAILTPPPKPPPAQNGFRDISVVFDALRRKG